MGLGKFLSGVGKTIKKVASPIAKTVGTVASVAKYVPGIGTVAAAVEDVSGALNKGKKEGDQIVADAGAAAVVETVNTGQVELPMKVFVYGGAAVVLLLVISALRR